MADLVTRLKLDDKDFNSKIQQSKKELSDYKAIQGAISSSIGKFASAIGVAGGAIEGFNKLLNSSQTLGDATAANMQALRNSVDEFFYSLGSGNLNAFLSGLDKMIDKAKDAYAALDQLGNTQISYDVFSTKNQSDIADAQYIAKNKFAPTEERNAAFEKWRTALQEQQAANLSLQRELINTASKLVEARTNANVSVGMEDMLAAFKTDLLNPDKRDLIKQRAKNGYNNYMANASRKDWTQEQKDALAESQKQNLIIHTMLEKYNDDELKTIAAKIQQYYQLNSALKSTAREYNETANEYNNANKKMQDFKKVESLEGYKTYSGSEPIARKTISIKPQIPAGSIADIKQQISNLQSKIDLEIDSTTRANLYAELRALESVKRVIEFQYKFPNKPSDLDGKLPSLGDMVKSDFPTKLPKFENVVSKKDVATNLNYADSLNAVANVMGSVSQMTNEGAAAWLTWGANVVTAVAAAIPAISTLITAKTAEAGVNAAASATQIPLVGWLLAGAAVASVLAAVATLPKFADGGIFQSPLTSGDLNLARLNGGEMILNKGQQANLFNLLDNGASSLGTSGEVKFTIQGKELVGVLNNYNNKISKVR